VLEDPFPKSYTNNLFSKMQFDWVIKKQHLKQRSGFQANPDLVIGLMKKNYSQFAFIV